jgi:hypothetical protein
MNETQLCAIEQSIRDEHHSELRWPHYVLLDLIAEIRRLRAESPSDDMRPDVAEQRQAEGK